VVYTLSFHLNLNLFGYTVSLFGSFGWPTLSGLTYIKMIELSSMNRYASPVHPAIFPHLTLILLGFGIFFTGWFFVYEVTTTKKTRVFLKELTVASVAATFMGFGTLFLLLWVGIYV